MTPKEQIQVLWEYSQSAYLCTTISVSLAWPASERGDDNRPSPRPMARPADCTPRVQLLRQLLHYRLSPFQRL